MAEDPFLPFMEEVSEIGDELKEAYVDDLKTSDPYGFGRPALPSGVIDNIVSRLHDEDLLHKWRVHVFVVLRNVIVVSHMVVYALVPVVLLSFVYLYLIGYIDRGGSKAGSSGSLDFRDIYISILLFQAAYVWIKFRDVIPRGAVYYRPNSNKFEPRIKFPVTRGVGGKSKRIPLGLYDTFVEGEVAYQIAAFYCDKRKHTGRLDLGGGASFSIPALRGHM